MCIRDSFRDNLIREFTELRKALLEQTSEYLKARAEIRAKLNDKREKEKKLIDLCLIETTEFEKIEAYIKEVSETEEADMQLVFIARKAYKNAVIASFVEKLNAALAILDPQQMMNVLKDSREQGIPLPLELEERTETLLEESVNNPQAFADKQKEAQKAAKAKPKK
eukprot:TRINITY_DN11753_c0_g1_i6.p1 TRINITY_DN11753_c0_g1~~TRINITY_DN11753_c0_g1_i6.p1  ORF type:complete len:183 (-),score=67.78 TRINITY_DN11753_c0_g1_i6:14-514(-)